MLGLAVPFPSTGGMDVSLHTLDPAFAGYRRRALGMPLGHGGRKHYRHYRCGPSGEESKISNLRLAPPEPLIDPLAPPGAVPLVQRGGQPGSGPGRSEPLPLVGKVARPAPHLPRRVDHTARRVKRCRTSKFGLPYSHFRQNGFSRSLVSVNVVSFWPKTTCNWRRIERWGSAYFMVHLDHKRLVAGGHAAEDVGHCTESWD